MAAAEPLQTIKEELTCPICLDLFRDPVTSACGHSFCRECIAKLCQGDDACPLCKEKLQKGNLRPNWELKNIVELLRSHTVEDPRRGYVCKTHREPLRFYCKEDQTAVCMACDKSRAHRGHTVVPMEEAVQDHRESIRQQLEGIESGYKTLNQLEAMGWTHLPQSTQEERQRLKRLIDSVATLLKVHTEGPRQRSDVAASQTQPCDPEARGSSARKNAGETESQERKGREPGSEREHGRKQASLDPGIQTINSTTEAVESKVDVKSLIQRFQALTPVKPGMGPGGSGQIGVSAVPERGAARGRAGPGRAMPEEQEVTETHVHKEAAPLRRVDRRIHWRHSTSGVISELSQADAPSRGDSLQDLTLVGAALGPGGSWQDGVSPGGRVALLPELQGCAVEVTLDPATAHPRLVLSEDRKSAERGDPWQDLPNIPERFDTSVCVLGSEGFTSGRRYWEVEVGPRGNWAIGVARDSVQRKGRIQLKPHVGIWAFDSLYVPQVPRKVGVYLDYGRGEVRFYNAETMALISFLTATFTGRLVPFFYLWDTGSRLSLSPSQR